MATTRTTWGIGDYPLMAERLEPAAEQAAELAHVQPGSRVLDVGCGTGTFARAAAARGGRAVGLDGEPVLLEIARWTKADCAGGRATSRPSTPRIMHSMSWQRDSASCTPPIIVPQRASSAARELRRACAPEGAVVLAAWTPASFMPAFGRAVGQFLPPPPASSSPPSDWADEHKLAAILADARLDLDSAETAVLRLSFNNLGHATSFLIHTAGHVLAERKRPLQSGQWNSLESAAQAVVEQ